MISFLFWNLNKKPLQERIARLVAAHNVDVLMLAECDIVSADLLQRLNQLKSGTFSFPFSTSQRIKVFTRFPASALGSVFEDPTRPHRRLSIRALEVGDLPAITLVIVHFYEQRNWNEHDQLLEAANLAQTIRRFERQVGHRRTVLVGDLNMNPFDKGVVAAKGLHAVMVRSIARKRRRKVGEKSYRFFYNPMWGCLGDRTDGPPGSHYYLGKHVSYFWNTVDQVLLRPALMDDLKELRIIDSDGVESLLTPRGLPDKTNASDHLPILFRLDLQARK